jgi:hypothetical protein
MIFESFLTLLNFICYIICYQYVVYNIFLQIKNDSDKDRRKRGFLE